MSWLIALIIVVVAYALLAGKPGQARTAKRWLWFGAIVVLTLVLLRSGFSWLAVAAGSAAALLSRLLPLLRLWPLLRNLREARNPSVPPGGSTSPAEGPMTRARALEVLGLREGASREEINKAYRQLMLKVHPDQGGSQYLARQLNDARKTLLA